MNRHYVGLSGVAIALIVLNHAIHFGLQVSPVEGASFKVLVFLQALGVFAVPAFLFVSGAFLAYAAREVSFRFVRSSLTRILWPYVIWSGVFFALVLLTADVRPAISAYARNLLVGYPYHFVPLLVFWYVTAPVVLRIGARYGVTLLVAVAAYQLFLLALRFPDVFGAADFLPAVAHALRPPVMFGLISDWGIYLPLGVVLGLHAARVNPVLSRVRWLCALATGALFMLGILDAFAVRAAPWARFVAPVPLMFLLPVIGRGSIPFIRRFEIVGRRSYGIYLAHFVVLNSLVVCWSRISIDFADRPFVVFPAFLILALGIPLVLMKLTARGGPARRVYRYVFGIVPPATKAPPRRRVTGDAVVAVESS